MSEQRHWTVGPYGRTIYADIDDGRMVPIVDVSTLPSVTAITDADMRLIAAAPDLLALVEAMEWACNDDSCCPWCREPSEQDHATGCTRQAALAKVRGDTR